MVARRSTFLALTLSGLAAVVLTGWYPLWAAAVWCAAVSGFEIASRRLARGPDGESRRDGLPYLLAANATVACWLVHAALLWATGDPAGWVIAIVDVWSVILHLTYSAQRRRDIQLAFLAAPLLALQGFVAMAMWSSLPWLPALAGTLTVLGTVLSLIGIARMAHRSHHRMEAALAEAASARAQLEFAIDRVGDGFFAADLDTMEYVSRGSLAGELGYPERAGDALADTALRVHPDDSPGVIASFQRCAAGELTGWDQEMRLSQLADGGYRWVGLRARVIAKGGRRTLVGLLTDLSRWKTLEADLRAAKDAAEASNRAKTAFLATMSHEIRTPLNGVLGMAQALAGDDLAPAQREKVAAILDSGKSLTALLNDVLDLSKIEAGRLEIAPVDGDLLHTIKRVRQLFADAAEEKGLDLRVRYDAGLEARLRYDPVRVRQCVTNLLSNAVKFTSAGRVEMRISDRVVGADEHEVTIEVADTGIGMDEAPWGACSRPSARPTTPSPGASAAPASASPSRASWRG
jgi:PAS domain-containing protein